MFLIDDSYDLEIAKLELIADKIAPPAQKAAVALVRAAGLRSEAESSAAVPPPFLDAASIPNELKGYVAVAVSNGLLKGEGIFRPQDTFTRGDLAHALAVLQRRATAMQ